MNRAERRAQGLVLVEGVLVERDALHIAEKVHEYDPNLRIQYLESAPRFDEPPFQIVEHCKDGIDRVVFGFWEMNDTVIERLYKADTQAFDIDARLTKQNVKAREDEKQRYREKAEEAIEIAVDVLKSPKSTYTFKDPETGEKTKFQ